MIRFNALCYLFSLLFTIAPVRSTYPIASYPISVTLPTGVPYSLYVDSARKNIHSSQVAARYAKLLAQQVASDQERSNGIARALVQQQARDLATRLASQTGQDPADVVSNRLFTQQQSADLLQSAANQESISFQNQKVVAASGQRAQAIANRAARAAAKILNDSQRAQARVTCGGKKCYTVINGGKAYCAANNTCAYRCFTGNQPIRLANAISCLNIYNDPRNCGSKGVICQQPYNRIGSTICKNGNCAVKCPSGFRVKYSTKKGAQ